MMSSSSSRGKGERKAGSKTNEQLEVVDSQCRNSTKQDLRQQQGTSMEMNRARSHLQYLMATRPGPFQLMRDKILPADQLFINNIANDPLMTIYNEKQKMNRRIHAKIKIHQYQEDGTFKLNDDIEPYTFAELFEQQRLILLYEYKKERYNTQNVEQTKMNVRQIIDKFSNMVSQNLHHLTIQELKGELNKFKLKLAGNKQSLVSRMVNKYEQMTNAELWQISSMSLSTIDSYLSSNNNSNNSSSASASAECQDALDLMRKDIKGQFSSNIKSRKADGNQSNFTNAKFSDVAQNVEKGKEDCGDIVDSIESHNILTTCSKEENTIECHSNDSKRAFECEENYRKSNEEFSEKLTNSDEQIYFGSMEQLCGLASSSSTNNCYDHKDDGENANRSVENETINGSNSEFRAVDDDDEEEELLCDLVRQKSGCESNDGNNWFVGTENIGAKAYQRKGGKDLIMNSSDILNIQDLSSYSDIHYEYPETELDCRRMNLRSSKPRTLDPTSLVGGLVLKFESDEKF